MIDSIKKEEGIQFPSSNSFLSFPQTGEEIERERKIENKKYIQTQLNIRAIDFETAQNIEREQRKKYCQTIVHLSGIGLKSNADIIS